jgi:hypothetical protein
MKKLIVISALIIFFSCNNNNGNKTNSENPATDSLATNPHAVPSHVDTITHPDGLSNQSSVTTDTTNEKDHTTNKHLDSLPEK